MVKLDDLAGNENDLDFDARLGRRWNLDPLFKPYYSTYLTFSNNPIVMLDPNGDADYYNQKGQKIGSDGNDKDKSIILVWDTEIERSISTATTQGMFFILPMQNADGTLRISPELGQAFLNALDRSNSPNEEVKDFQGGLHEEGFVRGVNEQGEEVIVESAPGPLYDENVGAELSMWKAKNEDQQGLVTPENATLDCHIHVKGESDKLNTGKNFSNGNIPDQNPSTSDVNTYRASMDKQYSKIISTVLGASNGKLYLYNSKGTYAKFSNFVQILKQQQSNVQNGD